MAFLKLTISTLAASLFCLMGALSAPADAAEAEKFHVNFGFSSRAFINTPPKDITVAVRILTQKVAKKNVGSADSQIYDAITKIEQDLKTKRLDAVALTPEDFLSLSSRMPLAPVLMAATDKGHEVELLMLVRKDSRIRAFRDLRSRRIAVPAKVAKYGSMYSTWIETLLMRQGFPDGKAFFASTMETINPSQALMKVFFRQADACVATDQVLELTAELNPQISRELTVLERLPKLANGIIVFRLDLPTDRKQKLMQTLTTLHEDQEGKQILTLFQLTRLVPFRPEYMRATVAFYAEHRRLGQRIAGRRK